MESSEFEWQGGHPAANFANTLDERQSPMPKERLVDYAALVEFTCQAHLIDQATAQQLLKDAHVPASENVWVEAIQLREALYQILLAIAAGRPPDRALLSHLESQIGRATAARQLVLDGTSIRWVWKQPDALERPVWELALAAEDLLISDTLLRTRKCAAEDCGVVFVDDSRAGVRRWCSMATCGNRHKVRQFREVRRSSAGTKQ